jgi:hypothetical protein
MISAEALFIQRAQLEGETKSNKIAPGCSETTRNSELGPDSPPTESLAAVVQDAERVMRRAVELVIART